jgi:hypothetical protein
VPAATSALVLVLVLLVVAAASTGPCTAGVLAAHSGRLWFVAGPPDDARTPVLAHGDALTRAGHVAAGLMSALRAVVQNRPVRRSERPELLGSSTVGVGVLG